MKTISILGSTGSIGVNTLDVVRQNQDRFNVAAMVAGSNVELLAEQVKELLDDQEISIASPKLISYEFALISTEGSGIAEAEDPPPPHEDKKATKITRYICLLFIHKLYLNCY